MSSNERINLRGGGGGGGEEAIKENQILNLIFTTPQGDISSIMLLYNYIHTGRERQNTERRRVKQTFYCRAE